MENEKKEIEWLKKIISAPISDFRDKYAKRKAKERLNELLNWTLFLIVNRHSAYNIFCFVTVSS